MVITRNATDVWKEICDKAEKHRASRLPVYTLRKTPNQIVKLEENRILRQSAKPVSDETGPSAVSKREVEAIWNAIRQDGQAVAKNIYALRFAWALVANFIEGIEFRENPFRLIVVNEEVANRV